MHPRTVFFLLASSALLSGADEAIAASPLYIRQATKSSSLQAETLKPTYASQLSEAIIPNIHDTKADRIGTYQPIILRLFLDAGGNLLNGKNEQSTGSPALDADIISATKATRFPPPPASIASKALKEGIEVHIALTYTGPSTGPDIIRDMSPQVLDALRNAAQ